MSDFKQALAVVLNHEKGWSNNPNDRGGPTNFGISQVAYSHFLRRPVSADEIRDLNQDQAGEVYMVMFWEPLKLGQITSQKIATVVFDMSVLMGQDPVIKDLQAAIKVKQDGIIGAGTLAVVNQAQNVSDVCRLVLQGCQKRMVNTGVSLPNQRFFLPGWIDRTHDLLNYAFSESP